ncbi:MAG: MATE family efflux transporter [Pseudomonadota bacterium]
MAAGAPISGPEAELTHSRVVRMALPVVLSNATVPLLGAVDTGVVGQLGEAAPIGAVGVGAVTLATVYWIFGFLRMGTAGLTAQAVGANDRAETSALMTRVLMIAGSAGLALIALQGAIFWGAFQIAPASAEVEMLARDYMAIRIFSAPAAIAIYGIGGWLVAHERTGALFWMQLLSNGLNIVLSIWFVLGLGWGVEGVALATLISEWAGLAFGLWLTREAFAHRDWRDWPKVFDRQRLVRMAAVNTDIMIRSVILMAGFTSFIYLAANYGDDVLAANQVLLQFVYVSSHAMDGFTFSAQALVGQAVGARVPAQLRLAVKLSFTWAFASCAVLTVIFAVWGGAIIDLMTSAEEVRAAARSYLPWMVVTPLLGCAAWMFDGVFVGATRTRDMRNMMIVSALIYVICLAVLLPRFENHGLWVSMIVFFVARGVSLGLRYPALERTAG